MHFSGLFLKKLLGVHLGSFYIFINMICCFYQMNPNPGNFLPVFWNTTTYSFWPPVLVTARVKRPKWWRQTLARSGCCRNGSEGVPDTLVCPLLTVCQILKKIEWLLSSLSTCISLCQIKSFHGMWEKFYCPSGNSTFGWLIQCFESCEFKN